MCGMWLQEIILGQNRCILRVQEESKSLIQPLIKIPADN